MTTAGLLMVELRPCAECGTLFSKTPGPGRWAHRCSECSTTRRYPATDYTPRPCKRCGALFEKPSGHGRWPEYCAAHRVGSNRKQPREHVCEHCDQPFMAEPRTPGHSRGPRRFCSKRCARLAAPKTYGPPAPRGWQRVTTCAVAFSRCVDCDELMTLKRGRKRDRCAGCLQNRWNDKRRAEHQPVTETAIVYLRCGECERFFVRQPHHRWGGECPGCSKRRRRYERRPKSAAHRRSFLLKRDKQVCQLCGTKTLPKWAYLPGTKVPHPKAPTVDHIVPVAQGGSHDDSNLQLAHFECNWRKADRPMGEQLRLAA